MSLTPRLLRRASQRLLYRSSPFFSDARSNICLQCRLFGTLPPPNRTQNPHGRRPSAISIKPRPVSRIVQKRTFLDLVRAELIQESALFIENHRQNRGIPVVATLVRYVDENIGFEPTTPELLKAFNLIVSDPSEKSLLRDTGVCYGIVRLLETLSNREELALVPNKNLKACLEKLHDSYHEYAVVLASILLDYIRRTKEGNLVLLKAGFDAVVATLANKGDYAKALGFLKVGKETYGPKVIGSAPWKHLLRKIIDMDNEEALLELTDSPESRDPHHFGKSGLLDGTLHFYLDRNDTANAKKWWDELKDTADIPVYRRIFDYAVNDPNDSLAQAWAEEMFQQIERQKSDPAKFADVDIEPGHLSPLEELEILMIKWKMHKGHSVDQLTALIPKISKEPKIEMLNELIEFALRKEEASVAQFLFMLADRWRLQQNRRAQILQIRLRMLLGDPAGAMMAWDNLRYFEGAKDSNQETMELLTLMASNSKTDPEIVKHLYDDILKQGTLIDADTLCTLTDYHLRRSPLDHTMKVITREINTYVYEDRRKVLKTIGEYMGLPETSEVDAWLIYDAVKQIFLELDTSVRKDFMQLFFEKGRADMGVVAFMDMRHAGPGARPDTETYTIAYRYLAKAQDPGGVTTVHSMMKIDEYVEPDTDLYNSLMWAYNSANLPKNALEVFKIITTTNEGPDNDTLSLVMITLGLIPGEMRSRGHIIWNNFKKLGIVPNIHNHTMRISAWCMNGAWDEALKLAKELEEKEGFRPDRNVIMTLYAEYQPSRRPEIVQWAEEKYPDVWAEIINDPTEPLKPFEGEIDRWWKGAGPILL